MKSRTTRNGRVSAGWILAMAMLTGGSAMAQPCDGQFQTGNGVPGISGDEGVIVNWDPDGTGPTPELLVAGGNYKLAGTTLVNSLATWEPLFNAQNPTGIWRHLAGGVTAQGAPGVVNTMLPLGTDLLVGGFFDRAGPTVNAANIARLDGVTNTWIPYGTGLPGPVFTAVVFNGQLFAGGRFRMTPNQDTDSVVRWTGTRWVPVGAGLSVPDPMDDPPSDPPLTIAGACFSLAVYNNQLYAGGSFLLSGRDMEGQPIECPNWAVWIPQAGQWASLAALSAPFPYTPAIYTQKVYGGMLYAGGIFDNIGNSIARFNGLQILPVDLGVSKTFDTSKVFSLSTIGSELIVGGDFETAGAQFPVYGYNVVRWNGNRYLSVADGGSEGTVFSTTPLRNQLAVMGDLEVVNGQYVRGISWYNGSMWTRSGRGQDGPIFAMTKFNNQIVAGGAFGRMANDVQAQGVAFFNGTTWSQVGAGLANTPRFSPLLPPPAVQPARPFQPPVINSFTTHNNALIAVGEFTRSGNTGGFANIASWNGQRWDPVGQVDGPVFAAKSYRNNLFIGGDLPNYGNVAQYDGFGGYQTLTFGADGPILALEEFNGDLVVGGAFTQGGGNDMGPIGRWNYDTETWRNFSTQRFTPPPAMPPILPQVNAIAVIDGRLYIGGNWIDIDGRANTGKFVRLNAAGTAWESMGANGPDYDVWVIKKIGNNIYVGGNDGVNIKAFDGTQWRTVDGGTDGPVWGIEELNGRIYMGGDFLTASGEVSSYFTSYIPTDAVGIASGPSGAGTYCSGTNVTLSVTASGTGPFTYQWKRNNVDVPGATAATLQMNGITAGQAGNYTVFVANGCSNATSGAIAVNVNAAPGITTHPQNANLCSGNALNLSVTATGSAPLAYQWKRNNVNIPGATNSAYTVASPQAGDAGSYTVVVSNACGSLTSNAATVTVNQSPAITVQPVGGFACSNGSYTLSVTATGTNVAYQWQRNNVNIPGATAATYQIASVNAGTTGEYHVVVSNACGSLNSNTAAVTTCGADFNCDNFVDFFDYIEFVDAYMAGTPGGDYNGDDFIDLFDYIDFTDAFDAGC